MTRTACTPPAAYSAAKPSPDESQAGNGIGSGDAHPNKLVWCGINEWVQETNCGRYRIERFVAGLIRDIKLERPGPNRYRALKRAPEWWGEFCPPAESADLAKQACEEDLNGTAADAGSTLVAAPMHTLPEA